MNAFDLTPLLLASARAPHLPETLAVAGTMARSPFRGGSWRAPVAGLSGDEFEHMLNHYFPKTATLHPLLHDWRRLGAGVARPAVDEFDDLVQLLLDNESAPGPDSRWLACTVATASMAENHLWQDLGLPSRKELNALMQTRYAPLKLKNSGDMKWKKFFYRQLCEAAEVLICKSPSCAACTDFKLCFGPEE